VTREHFFIKTFRLSALVRLHYLLACHSHHMHDIPIQVMPSLEAGLENVTPRGLGVLLHSL
jgi:hypothetical protein